jgi:hypothetical protein
MSMSHAPPPPPNPHSQAPIGGEYSATLTAVVNTTNIPYRFVQLDSWRYFKVQPTAPPHPIQRP